jgi:hypothetical protein
MNTYDNHCCDHYHIDQRPLCGGYFRNGCRKIRDAWKHPWCRSCRKTPAYQEHLIAEAEYKKKYAGMSQLEIQASIIKEAYKPEFFLKLEQ